MLLFLMSTSPSLRLPPDLTKTIGPTWPIPLWGKQIYSYYGRRPSWENTGVDTEETLRSRAGGTRLSSFNDFKFSLVRFQWAVSDTVHRIVPLLNRQAPAKHLQNLLALPAHAQKFQNNHSVSGCPTLPAQIQVFIAAPRNHSFVKSAM